MAPVAMVRKRKWPLSSGNNFVSEGAQEVIAGIGSLDSSESIPPALVGGVMNDENAVGNTNELRPLPQFCIGLMTLSVLLRSHLTISHDFFFEAFAGSCRLTLGVMMSQVPCV